VARSRGTSTLSGPAVSGRRRARPDQLGQNCSLDGLRVRLDGREERGRRAQALPELRGDARERMLAAVEKIFPRSLSVHGPGHTLLRLEAEVDAVVSRLPLDARELWSRLRTESQPR